MEAKTLPGDHSKSRLEAPAETEVHLEVPTETEGHSGAQEEMEAQERRNPGPSEAKRGTASRSGAPHPTSVTGVRPETGSVKEVGGGQVTLRGCTAESALLGRRSGAGTMAGTPEGIPGATLKTGLTGAALGTGAIPENGLADSRGATLEIGTQGLVPGTSTTVAIPGTGTTRVPGARMRGEGSKVQHLPPLSCRRLLLRRQSFKPPPRPPLSSRPPPPRRRWCWIRPRPQPATTPAPWRRRRPRLR